MGWVRLHRKLADHPIWTREKFTKGQAWVDLILLASYADHIAFQSTKAVTVKRGQVLTSQVNLAKRWRWNRETVRTFLLLLKSTNMVAIETSKATDTGYTLITLLNYDLYQGDSSDAKALSSAIDSAIRPTSESRTPPENSAIGTAIRSSSESIEGTGTYHQLDKETPPSEPSSIPPSARHPNRYYQEVKKGKKGKEPPPSVFNEQTFLEKFPPQDREVIQQTIQAIHSTRRRGKVADSIIQAELRWWDQQDPAQVIQGMRTYLEKGYADQGKGEKYLQGIIRNTDERSAGSSPAGGKGHPAIRRAAMSMTREDCSD